MFKGNFVMPCLCCSKVPSTRGVLSAPLRSSSSCRHPHNQQPFFPLPPLPQPHPISVAATQSLDDTWEYAIEEADIPECAGTLVEACIQTSRPASPNPFVGVELVGTFSAHINRHSIIPIFKAAANPHPAPPSYADSPPQTHRCPPPSLFERNLALRSRTQSISVDEPLKGPLELHTRCVHIRLFATFN